MTDVQITLTEILVVEGESEPVSITVYDGVFVNTGGGGGDGAVDSVNGETGVVVLSASDVGAQPVDADLTAIATLTTTSYGRALLAMANAAALRTVAGLGTAAVADTTAFQAADSDLTAIAALTTTTFGRSLLTAADAAGARTLIGAGTSSLALGTTSSTAKAGDYQPAAANISDASTIGKTILTAANAAAVIAAISAVPASRTVAGHALTADVTITASDVGAAAASHTHAESDVTGLTSDLAAKAPLASPALTGTPTVPTATGGTNTTQAASTAFVAAAVSPLAPLASPALTGNPTAPTPTAGDNDTSVATTAFVTNAVAKQPEVFMVAVSDEATAITTGTAVVTFRMPFAMTLTAVRASLTVASSSGLPTVNVKESGTTIFSTNLSIDATEKTSTTAATPAVISDASLADDAEMTVDITVAGTGAKGLKLYFIGTRT